MRSRRKKSRLVPLLTDAMFVLNWSKVRNTKNTQTLFHKHAVQILRSLTAVLPLNTSNTLVLRMAESYINSLFSANSFWLFHVREFSVFLWVHLPGLKWEGKRWCHVPPCTNPDSASHFSFEKLAVKPEDVIFFPKLWGSFIKGLYRHSHQRMVRRLNLM